MMEAGKYYVGDLCYVFDDEDWQDVCELIIKGNDCLQGEFNLPDGRRFAIFNTAWGDGEYEDQNGHKYCVDAGSIGCVMLRDVSSERYENLCELGRIVEFKEKFESIAKKRFGSGWVWLVVNKKGNLKVMSTSNQDNQLMNLFNNGGFPILGLDLWEHAYYLRYKNKRDDYVKNFFKAINWKFVNKMYNMKVKTKLDESLKTKQTLSEGVSESCSKTDNESYRFIFNVNPKVKQIYKTGIQNALKEVFSDRYYEKDEFQKGEMSGIYNLES